MKIRKTSVLLLATLGCTMLLASQWSSKVFAAPAQPATAAPKPAVAKPVATQPPASPAAHGTEPGLLLHFGPTTTKVEGGMVTDLTGKVKAKVMGNPVPATIGPGEGFQFNGSTDWLTIADNYATNKSLVPTREFTASAWVSIGKPTAYGSIIGCCQDNGPAETGWLLGYNGENFYLGVSSKGADDGDGKLTYMAGKTAYVPGRWYYVVGTYDGKTMRLYVNGKLDAESTEQSGDILYLDHAPFTIGCYKDDDEQFPIEGTLAEVKLYNRVISAKQITDESNAGVRLISYEPPVDKTQRFVVKPYLQFGTMTSMTIMWETAQPGKGWVEYGEMLPYDMKTEPVVGPIQGHMNEIVLKNLKPQTPYFYRTHTIGEDGSDLVGDALTFQTAVNPETPFAFVTIGDTQKNMPVIQKLQDFAYTLRPNFEIHLGDVVDAGEDKSEWNKEMLPASWALMSRVPVYPAIGNHEKNHSHYYTYFSLPTPEYYYTYTYGNAQFFVIDSNKEVGPGSEQYKWLDEQLGKSKATWKFVYHHHPVYSSDEDDYGDTYKTKSTFGDPKMRVLAALYEKHHVDIEFNGHVHCYERTWPIYQDKIDEERGTIYITSGGGGGGLESASPSRTWFMQRQYRGHHICYVAIHDKTLQFQMFDLEGRLFDQMDLHKK